MAGHTSEKRWSKLKLPNGTFLEGISLKASEIARQLTSTLNDVEERYQELLEIYTYAGGTDQDFANQLFREDIEGRGESISNTEELAKATDLVAAMLAAHQIWLCANNVSVAQEDRMALLRRMS